MILRRITKHVKDQNWFAVALDFFIVVIGVLFAFQVTEWNNERADRLAERSALERLIHEYNQNLTILADDKALSERTMGATADLLSMIAPEPDPAINDKMIGQTLLDCLNNPRFIPALGATKSLQASGNLGIIKDPDIQSALSDWQTKFQHLAEWQDIERMHGEELILGFLFEYVSWPDIDHHIDPAVAQSALTSDYNGLFSSKRFEGLLYNRWYNTRQSIGRLDGLDAETRILITRLETRLKELQ